MVQCKLFIIKLFLIGLIEAQDLEIIRDPRFAQDYQEAFKSILQALKLDC